jgi:L-tryptophan--pyruvate aminotransferase
MIYQHNCYIVICTRWAIVKELAIAQKMAQFIELNTIGVSQDAQVRATGLIRAIMKGYNSNSQLIKSLGPLDAAPAADHLVQPAAVAAAKDSGHDEERQFFHFGKAMMEARWKGVRAALAGNQSVTVQHPSAPAHCTFMGTTSTTNPGQNLPDPSHSSPGCGAGTESWT